MIQLMEPQNKFADRSVQTWPLFAQLPALETWSVSRHLICKRVLFFFGIPHRNISYVCIIIYIYITYICNIMQLYHIYLISCNIYIYIYIYKCSLFETARIRTPCNALQCKSNSCCGLGWMSSDGMLSMTKFNCARDCACLLSLQVACYGLLYW